MATTDISRALFERRKHYASVRMQQGRVIVDDDWNENERIENEDRRLGRVDVIGPAGSPNDGFRITDADLKNGKIVFDIQPGTFYVGGLRLELDEKQPYRAQDDWLQWPGNQQDAPGDERVDLIYLEAYQEPVSAVEDGELIEVALGGPDTSTRLRTMQRVCMLTGVKADCCYAWGELVGKLTGSLNEENELRPDTKLKVTFQQGTASADLCSPSVTGGYLGAENQAIRVQLVEKNKLTWGFDNAALLYRIQLDAGRTKMTLLTDPKDQAHWPLAGQVVEILPWSAVLPNNEKVAELQGHLSRVAASYNPDTCQLTLTTAVPTAGFDDWKHRSDKADLEKPDVYYYMRVWDRGTDKTSDPALSFTPGTPVTLGKTGLQVTITGSDQVPGDYWIIAARPETPDQVVPWDFEVGRRPHGVRRFYAPLALVRWKFAGGAFVEAEARDCRPRFLPLTQQHSCCRYTVGDGKASHGHFDSIEEALDHLPPAGGQICLLPGEHKANAVIEGKVDIKITGCGKHTRVRPKSGKLTEPIFRVVDCQSIVLEHMDLIAVGGTAIVLEGTESDSLREVEVAHNRILAYENGMRVKQGVGINVHHNTIRMLDKEKAGVGIYVLADDSLIERNDVGVVPAEAEPPKPPGGDGDFTDPIDPCAKPEDFYNQLGYLLAYLNFMWTYIFVQMPSNPFKALGGVQIAGGSERVRVLENRICGGAGNGVTLGSGLDLGALPDPSTMEEEGDVREHKVQSKGVLQGFVYSTAGDVLKGVSVSFRSLSDNKIYAAVTDSKGYFKVDAPRGEYTVSAPRYRAEGVDVLRELHFITLSETEAPDVNLQNLIAFLYEIRVEGNEISGMGLSGIGVPHVTLEELQRLIALLPYVPALYVLVVLALLTGTLGGFVVNSGIYRNHVRQCLQNVFDAGLLLLAQRRGMGGVSLGLCENLMVCENRIEDNGTNHLAPTCGVFVSFADQVIIERNQIVNNGPLAFDAATEAQKGVRGGVVVGLATSYPMVELLVASTGGAAAAGGAAGEYHSAGIAMTSPAAFIAGMMGYLRKGRQAARIHDNIVEQPVGQALAMLAWGPVSVANNQFNTDFAAESAEIGAVMIGNIGRPLHRQRKQQALAQDGTLLPNGNTLFCDNQTSLGFAGSSQYAQMIVTLDDLGFDGNQSDVLADQALVSNTALVAATLRASNSRFKEPIVAEQEQARLSLFTLGTLMNNTISNQGNHCIVALCEDQTKEVDVVNQALTKTEKECLAGKEQLKEKLLSGSDQ